MAFFAGSLLALQGGANVQLGGAMKSPFGASTLQLGIGTAILLFAAVIAGSLSAFGSLSVAPWHLIGGLGSALYITAGILLFPRLGAIVTVGLFIVGQIFASLVLDAFALLGVREQPVTVPATLGAVAIVVGIVFIVRAQSGGLATTAQKANPGWILLALAAGAALPIQGVINAQLRADIHAPFAVAAISFFVATTVMALLLMASIVLWKAPTPRVAPLREIPWWGWLGGLCGAAYVTAVFVSIPMLGVAPTVATTIAGQQIASVFVDRFGLLRLPRREISRSRFAGVALLLVGVAVVQFAK